jgi:hypothetical protein
VIGVDVRKVPLLLALATLIPIGALAWLGMRTLQQERDLQGQRQRERLEVAASRVAIGMERRLQAIDDQLAAGRGVQFLPTGLTPDPDIPIDGRPPHTIDTRGLDISSSSLQDLELPPLRPSVDREVLVEGQDAILVVDLGAADQAGVGQ